MERRNFIKTLCIASAGSMLAPGNIIASNACDDVVTVKMVGDLDDDLFVMRATNEDWTIEDCYQMHNQEPYQPCSRHKPPPWHRSGRCS